MGPQQLTWRWRVFAAVVIAGTRLLGWRVDVQGIEHVPRRGGAVLAFNHHSYLDFVMVAWGPVRLLQRPVRFLAKREILRSRKVGWIARAAGAVPVDRGSTRARADAFAAAGEALRQGDLVAVAPEQTISRSFELLPMRTGAARMAQLAGTPIVPVVGWGTQRVLTKGSRPSLRRRLPVTLRFGEPIGVDVDDDVRRVTEVLQGRMSSMLDEVQRTYPDGTPAGAPWVPARLGGSAPSHDEVLRDHQQRADGWADPPAGGGPAPHGSAADRSLEPDDPSEPGSTPG
jgi:1-acyl-sn-glycerol-3-phosphate acyltransferase